MISNSEIFNVKTALQFEDLALKVFRFQFENNAVYRSFCDLLYKHPADVKGISDIPFLEHNCGTFPYPIELREPVSIHFAYAFASGVNPYSLQNYPEYTYLYGVLYPLTLAPFTLKAMME